MKRLFVILTLLLVGLMGTSVAAQEANVDGLAMLRIEHGALAAGRGATFSDTPSDPNLTALNPASSAGLIKFAGSVGHTEYWENIRLESGYFAAPINSKIVWHGGIRFAALDDLEARQTPTADPLYNFDAYDLSFKTGASYLVSEKFAMGVSLGWIIEKIDRYRGSAFNIDLGATYRVRPELLLAASAINLGSDFELASGSDVSREISLPATYRAGASYQYDRYLGTGDLVIVNDDAHAHIGAGAKVHRMFSLRAGYMSGYDSKNLTAGASFKRRNLAIDYAFVPFTDNLGSSHMFNFTFIL